MTRRFDQASELRALAKRVREIRFRGTERYLEDLDVLARDMDARAAALVRSDEPTAESVFGTGTRKAASGRRFRAETRPVRRVA